MNCFASFPASVIIGESGAVQVPRLRDNPADKSPHGKCYEMMEPDPNMKVLVVDDSLVMRRIIINHLRSLGYSNILEADNGERALQILEKEQVGLILSDWCMRVMHGIEVLRSVRKNAATKDIPFIMVTAEAQPHLILEAIRAQVSDYVVKPFTRENLRESIEKVFTLGQVAG